ncbi:MFS-type transporter SLC18B1 isoform X2 [Agrilus planipennis]|nr:MFS-type transporter SLC18B1 isoform X2 [Agrilus planipennis]
MSILAPFFPKESSQRGMSETVAGFVFSFYALVIFISSPIFGKLVPKFGLKTVFIGGLLLSGVCNILFGLIQYVEDSLTFTILCFVIRGTEALGAGAFSVSGYVAVVNIFPYNAGAVRGILETFVGLGLSVGPAIGGVLFAAGGFGLPFYVVGSFTIAMVPLNLCLLSTSKEYSNEEKEVSFRNTLKIPSVLITCFIIIVVAITWSFLEPTLEPHLRKFSLSPENVGLVFLLTSAMYGISSPFFGWITDSFNCYWYLMPTGLLFSGISLLFLGPSPMFVFLEDSVWLNIGAVAVLGIAVAMSLMPTMQSLLDGCVEGGLGEGLATQSVVSGLWGSVYAFGEVLGPVSGGASLQQFGFPMTSTIVAILNVISAIIAFTYFMSKTNNSDATIKYGINADTPCTGNYKDRNCEEAVSNDIIRQQQMNC